MSVRTATEDEISQWDARIASLPGGSIFSTKTYAEQKQHGGYTPLFLMVDDLPVTVLQKYVFPLGYWWYLPKGPNVSTIEAFNKTVASLRTYAKRKGVFFIKTESELPLEAAGSISIAGAQKVGAVIPNSSTITVDITGTPDELLARLPQKGRHAIRRAERDGITVKRVDATDEHCATMFALLKETAEGQFGLRPYSYYQSYWQRFSASNQGQLFFAYHEHEVVAAAYAMMLGTKSTYKDGASRRERPIYGASHFLQWNVMLWAKERGATIHDLCGSPPSSEIQNKQHPHYGIGRFKRSFSTTVVDYIGCYDIPVRLLAYKAWSSGLERITKSLYFRRTHDYYY